MEFDGTQRYWKIFKEKFAELIINDQTMPGAVKQERLEDYLKGEALEFTRGVSSTFYI